MVEVGPAFPRRLDAPDRTDSLAQLLFFASCQQEPQLLLLQSLLERRLAAHRAHQFIGQAPKEDLGAHPPAAGVILRYEALLLQRPQRVCGATEFIQLSVPFRQDAWRTEK